MRLVRALALALMCLLVASHAHATWSVAQTIKITSCTSTASSCAVTLTSTTAGNVLIVEMTIATNDPITTITDNGTPGSSYTIPAGCVSTEPTSSANQVSCGYTLNVTGAVTSVTVNRATTNNFGWSVKIMEFHSTTTEIFDVVGTSVQSTASTSPVGPALTLSGTNDLVVQCIRGLTLTAVSGSYTLASTTNNMGYAYILNTSTAPAPTWTQNSAKAAMSGIAIKEPSGQPVVDVITKNFFPRGATP